MSSVATGSAGPGAVDALAKTIAAHLAHGLPLDAASLETILQALGQDDPARAFALLAADPEAAEHAPLLALALSPGQETRRTLEPHLAEADLDAAGATEPARQTTRQMARQKDRGIVRGTPVALLLPNGQRMGLASGPEDIAGFVRRLRPEATAPAELRRIVARRFTGVRFADGPFADGRFAGQDSTDQPFTGQHCAGQHFKGRRAKEQGNGPAQALALDVLIALRHSRLDFSPGRVFFLAALLERAPAESDQERAELLALTAWAVTFLDLAGAEPALREALRERRQALVNQLRLAEAQEETLERASFEVRLSQGQRQGYVHGPDLRAELALLDRACALALGLRGEELAGVSVRDLGQTGDAEALLRLLEF